jgi:hypothetical protein
VVNVMETQTVPVGQYIVIPTVDIIPSKGKTGASTFYGSDHQDVVERTIDTGGGQGLALTCYC